MAHGKTRTDLGSEKRPYRYATRLIDHLTGLRQSIHGRPEKPVLREWLSRAPYTLVLSSGFFGFFAHFGCIDALEESSLIPSSIAGSSAGAISGALWASGSSLVTLKARLFGLNKADFWDPSPGFGLLKGNLFRKILDQNCAAERLEECKVPVSISAFDLVSLSTHSLRKGPISDLVYASCCVPFLFQPIRIGKSLYFDGGIGDRPGLNGIPNDARVLYHHLPSRRIFSRETPALNAILKNRPNTIAVMVRGLEAVDPERLNRGEWAFQQARDAFLKALERPIGERVIII